MHVLLYHDLNPGRIPNFAKLKSQLEAGDFRSADARKVGDNLFRARLDRSNRILFSFARYAGESYILVLEYIPNHAYEKSRFLARGASIDETRLPELQSEATGLGDELTYVNRRRGSFNVLDKIIFFDDEQQEAFALAPPFIVIGSAGSGKTVLTLEKMKEAQGSVLYVTRSPYLVDKSRETYYALNYENEDQEIGFLSYAEFLESIRVPPTREIVFAEFARWFSRHRQASGLKDAYQLFEEFNGVITGSTTDAAYLDRTAYEALGVRQSIYPREDRRRVYGLFLKYLEHLGESERHDINILSHEYRSLVEPEWDFAVIDEIQDFTNTQMDLVLRSLRDQRNFILCGDSNQIVHPNFFSWSGVKRYFYGSDNLDSTTDLIRILTTNYRNSGQVTEIANRILRLKHARFRSVDKESNHLVTSRAREDGAVLLLPDTPAVTRELDDKTHESTRFAVIVLHPDRKAEARRRFRTPLVFTIQEAKGLEYDNVILYGFVSGDERRFREIARGVNPQQVQSGELTFARARDKSDKSLEIYKFHINALYVAVTRAMVNVYLVESAPKQRLFDLLGIAPLRDELRLESQASSLSEWRREAQKLERQGKDEQAADIRTRILGIQPTPWTPLERGEVRELTGQAVSGRGSKKAMLRLYEYALLSHDRARVATLAAAGFRPARQPPEAGQRKLVTNRFMPYSFKHAEGVHKLVEKYGVDHRDSFNCTPLMLAARFGHNVAAEMLVGMNANPDRTNSAGLTAFQIMLQEASLDKRYARRSVPSLFNRLQPADVTVMVRGRLVKLDSHKAEFLFFNLFVALFHTKMPDNVSRNAVGLRSADLVQVIERLPRSAVPTFRTKRQYVSAVLARNEVDRDAPYNRRIFRRTRRGVYILNPAMRVRVADEWVRIYDLMEPEVLLIERETRHGDPMLDELVRDHRAGILRNVMAWLADTKADEPETDMLEPNRARPPESTRASRS